MLKLIISCIFIVNVHALVDWKAVQQNNSLPDLPEDVCEVGKYYKLHCNVCECIPPGIPQCGDLSCIGDQDRRAGDASKGCVVGTIFHDKCNICDCKTGNLAICTVRNCHEFPQ